MPCIEHVALHVSPSVLCTQKHVLHDCLQGFCKNVHGTWCPKSVKESPCRNISRESSGLRYLSWKKLCMMLSPRHDQSQRRDNVPAKDGYIRGEGLSVHVWGLGGATGWMQLQTAAGIRNSLLAAFTSILKQALHGKSCLFFSPKYQPFSSHNLVALKYGTRCISLVLNPGRMLEKR